MLTSEQLYYYNQWRQATDRYLMSFAEDKTTIKEKAEWARVGIGSLERILAEYKQNAYGNERFWECHERRKRGLE